MEYQRAMKSAQKEHSKTSSSSLHQTSLNRVKTHPLLELQRTIGNQAVLNMLRSGNMQTDTTTQTFVEPGVGHDFSRIPIHSPQTAMPQTKLRVSQPGDIYEQEADRVAEQVMRTAAPESPVADDTDKAKNSLTRKQSSQPGPHVATDTDSAPPIIHDAFNSGGGQPLDATTRAFMEPRFGHDFSQVRVHANAAAEQSARELNAYAYTVGYNIVFGTGQFVPGSHDGRRLLAHELVHVMQQEGSTAPSFRGLQVTSSNDPSERDAGRAFNTALSSQQMHLNNFSTSGFLARQISEEQDDVTAEQSVMDKEEVVEVKTEAYGEFELILPANAGLPRPMPTKKPLSSHSVKGKKSSSYPVNISLKLPRVGGPDRSLNTAQISQLAKDEAETTAGLTQLILKYHTRVTQQCLGTKHWVTLIEVILTNGTIFRIYLTKENTPGSCADRDLLRHEMHHVADAQKNVSSGEESLRVSLLGGSPVAASPVDKSVISMEDVRKEIMTLVDRRIWDIMYNQWLDGSAWDVIDYPTMYSSCPGMKPVNVVPSYEAGYPGKPPEVFSPELPR